MCSSKNRQRLLFLLFYHNMRNITEGKVMSWGRNLWEKKTHDFIPESNNANNLSEMLPNELWRKTFMSLNVVLGCGIVIYQGFIFPLKKSHKKSEQNIKQWVCLMKMVFYMLLTSCGCKNHPSPPFCPHCHLTSHLTLSLSRDTNAQCVCSGQAAAKSLGEKFASSGLGSFFSL